MAILEWRRPIVFRSEMDEKVFFSWLESIPGVTRVEGKGRQIIIHMRSRGNTEELEDFAGVC